MHIARFWDLGQPGHFRRRAERGASRRRMGATRLFATACGLIGMVSLTLVTCASTSAASPVANHKHHHKNKNHHKKLTPISFGLAAYVCEFGPYLVAKDKGFFTKEGLTVTFKQVAGSQSISALESGSLQLAGAAGSAVAAVMKGAPVKAISVDLESPPYLVVAKKTISSLSALAGGKLGIMTEGDTVQFGINELMAQNGINVTSVAEVPVGYAPNNISALQGGSVPASYLTSKLASFLLSSLPHTTCWEPRSATCICPSPARP